MKNRKITITSGNLVEVCIYPMKLAKDTPKARAEKSKETTAIQKYLNFKSARKRLERLIACNFDENDLFVTLTYEDGKRPKTKKEAKTIIKKYIRALRETRRKQGKELKYIYTTENKHGEKNIHHHFIINSTGKEDLETIVSLWTYGQEAQQEINRISRGSTEGRTFEDLAQYMTKEAQERSAAENGDKMWIGSKNLETPITERGFISENESADIPYNAKRIEQHETFNAWGHYKYIKYYIFNNREKKRKTSNTQPRAGSCAIESKNRTKARQTR